MRFIDARELERSGLATRSIERRQRFAVQRGGERRDARLATGRTAIDVRLSYRDSFGIRAAALVAATPALGLRKQRIDSFGECEHVVHGGAILGNPGTRAATWRKHESTIMAAPHSHDRSTSAHVHGSALHAHDGDAHDHQLRASATTLRALAAALALTGGFAIVEAVGGILAGSLALLSDAGHMATDAAALGLALFAQWVARRPPSPRASYGYARAEVLAAFVNALALLLLVGFIVVEAVAHACQSRLAARRRCWSIGCRWQTRSCQPVWPP